MPEEQKLSRWSHFGCEESSMSKLAVETKGSDPFVDVVK